MRRSAFLLGPAGGVADGDLLQHRAERHIQDGSSLPYIGRSTWSTACWPSRKLTGNLGGKSSDVATTRPQLVVPFRGERFAAAESPSRLIAPPYDVITPAERARLAASDSHNIVQLILPEAPAGEDRYARAAELLATWRRDGVLAADAAPAVYVLAQEYQTPGDSGEWRTRTGMFAAVAAEPYETGRVRPHERTHSSPKADRLALLRAARTSLESIFLLAPDPDGALLAGLRQVTTHPPVARAELENVRMNLCVVGATDATRLAQLASPLPPYIADGHHRYETAVADAHEEPPGDP